jgi:adenine phosphoribosyltransferase
MEVDAAPLRSYIRDIEDYPESGVTFRDITPLVGDGHALTRSIDDLVDSRGFIFGAAVAYRLGAAFVPVRKAGKLPWAVVREEYDLEYGSDKLEIHRDAIHPGEQILVIDDVLATGGTAAATARLIETLGGEIIGLGFVIELTELGGRSRLGGRKVETLLRY